MRPSSFDDTFGSVLKLYCCACGINRKKYVKSISWSIFEKEHLIVTRKTTYIWGTQAVVVAITAFEYLIEEDHNFELYAEQDSILQRHLDLGLDSF